MSITSITLKDIEAVINDLKKGTHKIENLYSIYTIDMWKNIRDNTNFCWAKWTDVELNNYDKTTGSIGTKAGVDCFVELKIKEYERQSYYQQEYEHREEDDNIEDLPF